MLELTGPDVIAQLEALRTPDDDAALLESYEAELRGDAAAALDAMSRTFHVVGSRACEARLPRAAR